MYVKLFTSIYQGTLRGNSNGLLVFTNLLAHCDVQGFVDITPRVIADEVGLDLETVKKTLLDLESVDPESRSPEMRGRRIVRIDEHRTWGWKIVNYEKYRAIRNEDERREQNRLAQQRMRSKKKSKMTNDDSHQSSAESAHAEGDEEAEVKADVEAKAVKTIPREDNKVDLPDVAEKTGKRSGEKKGTRLREDWFLPKDWGEWAMREEGKTRQEVERQAVLFRDYWIAKAGANAIKRDWFATWRNWIRNPLASEARAGPKDREARNKETIAEFLRLTENDYD